MHITKGILSNNRGYTTYKIVMVGLLLWMIRKNDLGVPYDSRNHYVVEYGGYKWWMLDGNGGLCWLMMIDDAW